MLELCTSDAKILPLDLHGTKIDADFLQSVDIRDYSEAELCTESFAGIPTGPSQQIIKSSGVNLEFSEILEVLAVVERTEKHMQGLFGDRKLESPDQKHSDDYILQKYLYNYQLQPTCKDDKLCSTQELPENLLKKDMTEELPNTDLLEKPPSDPILFPSSSFNKCEKHYCHDEHGPLSPMFSMIDEQGFVQLVRDARTMEFKFLLKQSEELFDGPSPR